MSKECLSATRGDDVCIIFTSGEKLMGRVQFTPSGEGDSWVIITESGTIFHVQHFETIEVTSRKVKP